MTSEDSHILLLLNYIMEVHQMSQRSENVLTVKRRQDITAE
jgi:hypothetical protein